MCLDTSCSCDVLRKKINFASANYANKEFVLVNLSPQAVVIVFSELLFFVKAKQKCICWCLSGVAATVKIQNGNQT